MRNWRTAAAALASVLAGACATPEARLASPSYDVYTQRLVQLQVDRNGDGRIDQWTYADGPRLIRGEADTDSDGRVDRWEYFDDASALTRVGTSSANDGVEDTWAWTVLVNGEGRVDRARARDRRVDRTEYYRGDQLTRSEEDSNGDGRLDRWDYFEAGVMRRAEFDTTFTAGRANRRVLYDAGGRFVQVEADPEFDGTFVAVGATTEDLRRGQGK